MCLLASRQDILLTRDLSNHLNHFAALPLPAENARSMTPTAFCKSPRADKQPFAGWLLLYRITYRNTVIERQAGTYLHAKIIVRAVQPVKAPHHRDHRGRLYPHPSRAKAGPPELASGGRQASK